MSGNDEMISGSKIEPLDSATKRHAPKSHMGGSVGDDQILDSSKIGPMEQNQTSQSSETQGSSGGSVGKDSTIASTKIEPLSPMDKKNMRD